MPRARKKTSPSKTFGDIITKASSIKTTQILYAVLIVASFLLGYLVARVQLLEKASKTAQIQAPTAQAPQNGQPQAPVGKVKVANGKLPVNGKESAKITIVEFSDFQCPFCGRFYTDTLPQIRKDYIDTGKVKLYYRHFPLDFHPAALPTAIASECANEQNKFWEFHDKVFNEQDKISVQNQTQDQIKEQLKTWGQELGLNTSQFDSCLDSEKYKNNVTTDTADGKTAGTSGTPTFYINGTQLVGAQPFSAFKTAIDKELQ
ncbi:MAG: disulfide bond formation protein DsbA [Candidatus Levybacteria bacterium CG_4_10_14_0_2_um_filter_36_16]|nr:MAG: hypothetical protein AUK12_00030 [Candidatus Levybacteria bacterium CG2_30_37_29]PIR79604.1 MAG: disulfide bond formation protein DsbA [Candidatus Levybacteria bacterium CG10_big_fil_rev_8_21_14_0_10_36_30]PIZ97003.1 MAG: disulfide bond formation protein DsbA [Candidatus Levybacteria bacterium CG_4_10_14_0_2_um_filter_36_16]